ncbi:MAG TPA: PGPGW domain-containing protein [Candidatus Acidoferrales bacterium]
MFLKTVQQAKRFFKILIGFTLLLVGVIMWFTPGPGWAAVIGGLVILSAEFVWARTLLNKLKEKGYQIRDAVTGGSKPPVAPVTVEPKPPQES